MTFACDACVTHDQMHLQKGLQGMCILPGYSFVPRSRGLRHPCRGWSIVRLKGEGSAAAESAIRHVRVKLLVKNKKDV